MNKYFYERNYTDQQLKELEAEYVERSDVNEIINETTIGYDENGDLLFYFIKNKFDNDYIKTLEPFVDKASTFIISLGRGASAGKLDMTNPLWAKGLKNVELNEENYSNKYTLDPKGIAKRKYKLNNPVYSNLIGYFEKPLVNFKKTIKRLPKCRLTQFSARNLKEYLKIIPYIEKVSSQLKIHCPEPFDKQNDFVAKHRERIGDSCYSTITINKNFRTAIHTDKGDFKDGIGTITTMGDYTGGEFCLIDYKVAFNLKPTDILFVDVHKHHANLPFEGTRYSLVSYVRENIYKCGLKYNYRVVIPSYGRADILGERTLAMLERGGVSKDRIDIWIVKEEVADYLKYELDGYRVIEGVKGISKQREFISGFYEENTPLVWFDDDCMGLFKKIVVDDDLGVSDKHLEIQDYEKYFLNGFEEMEKKGVNLMGVYPIRNILWMKNRITEDLKFCIGASRLTFNKKEYEKAGDYTLLEDYERTLKYFIGDGSVLRNEGVYIKHNFLTLKGGIGATQSRTNEDKVAEVKKFVEQYPNYSRMAVKKNTCDVRFKSVKRFEPKNNKYFLFLPNYTDKKGVETLLKIYNNIVDLTYDCDIYMYIDTYIQNSDEFETLYNKGVIKDADLVLEEDKYNNPTQFIIKAISQSNIYIKNNDINIDIKSLWFPQKNIINKSIIKLEINSDILKELLDLKDLDAKTLIKYAEIFNVNCFQPS